MTLLNKIAVVTGGSRGIGAAIVSRLTQAGATVFFNYHQDPKAADDLVRTIHQAGGKAMALKADGADFEAMRDFCSEVINQSSEVDILVNNVGTASITPMPLGSVDPKEYDRIFDLNTRGLFFTSQHLLPHLRDGGRIVNISSVASRWVAGGRSVYAGSKAAIEAFTRVWAAELGGRGITVNSVSPGLVDTERLRRIMPPEVQKSFLGATPLARLGQPDDIANVVFFLCSTEGGWMTAQNLTASGGLG